MGEPAIGGSNKPNGATDQNGNKPGSGTNPGANPSTQTGTPGTRPGTGTKAGPGPQQGQAAQIEKGKSVQAAGLSHVKQGTPLKVPVTDGEGKKKKRSKKKSEPESKTYEQASLVMMAFFGMIGTKPGCQHWEITKEEADSICRPAFCMLEKSDAFSKIAEHSDAIALVSACGMVFVPRLIATGMQQKERKAVKKVGNTKKPNVVDYRKDDAESAAHDKAPAIDVPDTAMPCF